MTERNPTDFARWSDPARLEPAWNERARVAANYVPAGARVLDLGCGAMVLEAFLPRGCDYQPCDLTARDERTMVCDFNRGDFPAGAKADIVTALGVLEYVADLRSFLRNVRALGLPFVTSYCPVDLTATLDRGHLGWINNLSVAELERTFAEAGFRVTLRERIDPVQLLFRLEPDDSTHVRQGKRVLVLSYNNAGNFGDRLGFHLLNEILPGHAVVTQCHFQPWDVPHGEFELVIVGIGNSLFEPLITESLLSLVRSVPKAVGIFGTQYRGKIDTRRMRDLTGALTHWYARNTEDPLLYGRGAGNASHLGDWLVNAFPLGEARVDEPLVVGEEILADLPLDRVIQRIQRHRRVVSTRLHPFLCALTSAEEVAYREQREDGSGEPSGKFRSLLIDVFGRDMPEDRYFAVDRAAVAQYRRQTLARTQRLREHIARLLA